MKNENKNYEQLIKMGDNWPSSLPDYVMKAIKDAAYSLPDLKKCTNAELDILTAAYQGIAGSIQKFKKR